MIARLARTAGALVLRLYPREFRRRYGAAFLETLADCVDDAVKTAGGWSAAARLAAELADAIGRAVTLRLHGARARTRDRARRSQPGGAEWLRSLGQDVRFALRASRRQPLLAVSIVLLLAVSIGANSAIFSVVNAYLVRPLPFPESDRLLTVSLLPPDAPMTDWRSLPSEAWSTTWPDRDEVIEQLVAWDLDWFTLVGDGEPLVANGGWVTPGYFGALGTRASVGRVFSPADANPGAPAVAVISHALWTTRFGADSGIVGRGITAYASDRPFESETFTVVGVLPEDFWFLNRSTDFLAVLRDPRAPALVRIQPDVPITRATDHFTAIVRSQVEGLPESWRMYAAPVREPYVASVRPVILVLVAAVGLVLLLACSNVAILMLTRAVQREREITVRRALGASRRRLARQLLTEGLVLAVVAGAVGIAVASMSLDALGAVIQSQLGTAVPGGLDRLGIDPTVLIITAVLSLGTGVLFAAVPAMMAAGTDLTGALSEGGRTGTDGRRRHLARNVLIAGEVAVSLALLVGAGLMIRTAANLSSIELGFVPDQVLTANITLRERSYPEAGQRTAFVDRLESSMQGIPGVAAGAVFAQWPFQGVMTEPVRSDAMDGEAPLGPEVGRYIVGPGYFDVARVPLLRGRAFDGRDREGSEPVAIVGETLAQRLWPGTDPLGRRLRLGPQPDAEWRTVVGVVNDVREELVGPQVPDVYVPYAQAPRLFLFVMARVTGGASDVVAGLRRAVSEIDGTAAVTRVAWMNDIVTGQGARPRFLAGLLTAFGVFAAGIALFGLYSLIAYSVGQRRHEIAVRVALGADPRAVIALFLREGGQVIGIGVLGGIAAGLALTRGLEGQLYGVTPRDWAVFAGAAFGLAGAAFAAVWLTARRAADTDPSVALKSD